MLLLYCPPTSAGQTRFHVRHQGNDSVVGCILASTVARLPHPQCVRTRKGASDEQTRLRDLSLASQVRLQAKVPPRATVAVARQLLPGMEGLHGGASRGPEEGHDRAVPAAPEQVRLTAPRRIPSLQAPSTASALPSPVSVPTAQQGGRSRPGGRHIRAAEAPGPSITPSEPVRSLGSAPDVRRR
jgi:hypothetical protein